jgi:tetratricopeptide (TPR) repeat protein
MKLGLILVATLVLAACEKQMSGSEMARACPGGDQFDPQESVRACNEMLEFYEEGSGGYGSVLTWRAKAKERTADVAGARQDYEAALEINPDNPTALLRMGGIFLDAGDLHNARTYLHRSIEVHDSGIARDLLGGNALLRGDYQEALKYYDELMETDWAPGPNATALYGRGVARLRLNDEGGRTDIQLAEETDPTVAERFQERGIRP